MKKKEWILIAVAAIILIGFFSYIFVAFKEPRYNTETVQTTVSPEQLKKPSEILVSEKPTVAEATPEPQPQPAPAPPPYHTNS